MRGPWLLVALALAGCGAPPPPSGSRLHARWQVARGTRRLAGWRDTKLGVDCSFEEYFAGRKHRCVPAMAFAGSHRFADVACTEPLVQWFDCEPPPRYAKALPENSCDGRPVFYEVGEAVDGATAFERTSTGCVPARLPPPLFRQGARVPEEEFVAAEERPGAAGQLELVAEDGAIAPWGGWDGVRAVQPSRTRDGQRRWAPWMVAYASQFADTACTVPAASKDASSARCPLDGALKFEAMTACGEYTVSFWSLGAPVSATYGNDGGACRQADSASRLSWALGAPIPDEQLESAGTVLEGDGVGVKLERATLHGQPIHHTASHQLGGNAPPTPDPFIDTASGRPCEPAVASDGSVRCIVAGDRRALVYRDAACGERFFLRDASAQPRPNCPPASAATLYVERETKGCKSLTRVWPVLDEIVLPETWIRSETGACERISTFSRPAHRLGPEIPPSRFVEVMLE